MTFEFPFEEYFDDKHMAYDDAYSVYKAKLHYATTNLVDIDPPQYEGDKYIVILHPGEYFHEALKYATVGIYWNCDKNIPNVEYSIVQFRNQFKNLGKKWIPEGLANVRKWGELFPDNAEISDLYVETMMHYIETGLVVELPDA